MDIIPPKEQVEMEKAIKFLIHHISCHCRNKKPLIMHSLRVGFEAEKLGLSQEAVLAAFLHDLVEDTDCKLSEIKKEFGKGVADLVWALTQYKIKDYKLRWQKLLAKIKKAGKTAMILKVLDSSANLPYFPLIQDREILEQTFWKINFIIKNLKPYIGQTAIFKNYEKAFQRIVKKLRGR